MSNFNAVLHDPAASIRALVASVAANLALMPERSKWDSGFLGSRIGGWAIAASGGSMGCERPGAELSREPQRKPSYWELRVGGKG